MLRNRIFTAAKAQPVAGPAPMTEKERLAQRAAIKARIAELTILEADRKAIQDRSTALDNQLDQLAADHVESLAPIQEELRSLEDKRIQTTIDRQPSDPADESRRLVLIDTIAEANRSLAESLKRVREKQAPLSEESITVLGRMGSNVNAEQSKLIRLGREDLLDELFVATRSAELADSRAKVAQRELSNSTGDAARRWGVELEAAQEIRTNAQAEVARIRAEIIAE